MANMAAAKSAARVANTALATAADKAAATAATADQASYIADAPLPLALDAEQLKSDAIAMLQAMVGLIWSNYNDSDPGVTILDQLCYALTELGYCGQFPIEDVLTQADGQIRYHDQFFEPQNILTCSPVTFDDYRKLVLDAVPAVRAIYIQAETCLPAGQTTPCRTGRYTSYLCLKAEPRSTGSSTDSATQSAAAKPSHSDLLSQVQVLLNQHRNLCEYFLPPALLKPKTLVLAGCITLASQAELEKVKARIHSALYNYAVPIAVQSGYSELMAQGLEANQIFNGPKLQHGWIAGPLALQDQRTSVNLCDLITLIAAVPGVLSVDRLNFVVTTNTKNSSSCVSAQSEISLAIDEMASILLSSTLVFMRNGAAVAGLGGQATQAGAGARQHQDQRNYLQMLGASHRASSVSAGIDLAPPLPRGEYRDIESYYSVQNTFPDIYGIGLNSWRSNAPNFRSAQSRQLQGYLMPFDQLLANEFSQVAHLSDLFSFGPTPAGATPTGPTPPSKQPDIPWQKFATTYFCQPLYDIPDVKSLLLGNNAFNYQFDSEQSAQDTQLQAWKKYQAFEFNEYIHGLRQCVENDSDALTRRDAMLSHLMARHGDDASLYDDMIAGCRWLGGVLQTRIIVKTIWLQNFELLSYRRARAFNGLSRPSLPSASGLSHAQAQAQAQAQSQPQPQPQPLSYPQIDGQIDQQRVYREAKLSPADLQRYSAFELKTGILLDLPTRWRLLAAQLQALLAQPSFIDWLLQPPQSTSSSATYALAHSDLSVQRSIGKPDQLFEGKQCLMQITSLTSGRTTAQDYQAYADQLSWLATQTQGGLLIESVLLLEGQGATNDATSSATPSSAPLLQAWLLFPGYITLTQQPPFAEYIKTLVQHHWPAHLQLVCAYLPLPSLRNIIAAYVKRNNSFKQPQVLQLASALLRGLLSQLTPATPAANAPATPGGQAL